MPVKFKSFTGGAYATNCFLAEAPGGSILFDAPEGSDKALSSEPIGLLVLTHGHWDHVADAAAIRARHSCPVVCHAETAAMVSDGDFFRRQGFPFRFAPFQADRIVGEGKEQDFLGLKLDVLEVPGHCPGSLCFYSPVEKVLVGGDVLFNGAVGRWDLPGGDGELLLSGIREKILTLPHDTTVLPGHGPNTAIGREKSSNPFLRG